MAEKNRKVSLLLLVLLLIVAAMNYVFVNMAFNKPSLSDKGGMIAAAGGGASEVDLTGKNATLPELSGEVVVEKRDDGKYEITISAHDRKNQPVILEGFSADVHILGMTTPRMIPAFRKVGDGKYAATLSFPEKGRWEVRVRLNRKNESLEFYESFDIF